MRHGLFAAIVDFFKNLHGDAATFFKWAGIGGGFSGIFLFGSSLHGYDLVFTIIVKCCYTCSLAILSGMAAVIGKKIGHWVILKFKKKKPSKEQNNFSKNGQDKNVA